eukprot:175559-Alexandrium_andersonii.AAC.1
MCIRDSVDHRASLVVHEIARARPKNNRHEQQTNKQLEPAADGGCALGSGATSAASWPGNLEPLTE